MAKKWIQGAIKHPGALHRDLEVGRRARMAQTLKKLN